MAEEVMPEGDFEKGKLAFGKCTMCHSLKQGVNGVGPSLYGIIGRQTGSVPKYAYSPGNKKAGITWNEETLFKYLKNPEKTIPRTKMVLKVDNPQERADIIAYLKVASKE